MKVAKLKEKIRESRLRWYGHVKRKEKKRRGRVCQMVHGIQGQGDGNKEERATEKAMGGLCSR